MLFGAHCSGGIKKALDNAVGMNADVVQLFVQSPRTWRFPNHDPKDLEAFRADIDGGHDEIEEWEFQEGRVFAAVGTYASEADPNSGHGRITRLYDAGALGAAGFTRVRKVDLV